MDKKTIKKCNKQKYFQYILPHVVSAIVKMLEDFCFSYVQG